MQQRAGMVDCITTTQRAAFAGHLVIGNPPLLRDYQR
jgi:hypothetical protein